MANALAGAKTLNSVVTDKGKGDRFVSHGSSSWLWLMAAVALLFFADGRDTIALAAWLAPALLLRFVRTQPAVRGLAMAYVALILTRGVAMRGMIPIPGAFYYIFLVISNFSALLPYVADRVMTPRLKGWSSTLVFPCTLVTAQFIYSHGPVGSWGSIPYTQSNNLPLLQLLSVTGLWGITFLIGWFAATVNSGLQQDADRPRRFYPLALFAAVYCAVVLAGGARLALFPPTAASVRVASLSPAKQGEKLPDSVVDAVTGGTANNEQISAFRTASGRDQDELLRRTEQEAEAGAKIIFWSETATYLLKNDEPTLLTRASGLAARQHVYLGLALGTWTPGTPHPLENKFVFIEPSGQIAWQYWKARPTPGPELAASVKSDGRLRQLKTEFGTVAAAICYDTDFPALMAQAGTARADILLSPANDWKAIDPRHTEIASFRAIEQGFNLVRQSNGGLSATYDYQGRGLAAMDGYQATDLALISQVPTRGTRTVYSVLGDWFAWLAIATLLVLVVLAWRSRRV